MHAMEQFLQDHVWSLRHWPWLAVAFTLMMFGQVAKTAVWTRYRAKQKGRLHSVWWWGYKTLPIHPVAAGAAIGFFWRNPEEGVVGLAASLAYFASAGGASVWAYQLLKGLAKRKGIDLALPGESSRPSGSTAPEPAASEEVTPVDKPGTD